MKVYISPSTQEGNKTALGISEEQLMHELADELIPLLVYNNMEVIRGRKEQTLAQMVAESNNNKVDIHVALHSNAYNTKTRGCEIYHYSTSTKSAKLARCIYNYLEPLTPTADRGLKHGNHLYEVAKTKAPAVLIEIDFHDNYEGAKWISDNKASIAEAIAKGICDYFGIKYKSPIVETSDKYKKVLINIKKMIDEVLGNE